MNDSLANTVVLDPSGPSSMFSLLRAAEAVESRLEAALANAGLSLAKFSVLSELVAAGKPVALCDLASRLSCVRSNVTQLVDRLESDGLVARVADPSDRRSVRAALTAFGADRHAAGRGVVVRLETEFNQRIGAAQRAQLEEALATLG